WNGDFFLCQTYNKEVDGDDDWACDWSDVIDGKTLSEFGRLYRPDFCKTAESRGINLYLIARTVATFGRCCDNYRTEPYAFCIGFHDQDPIMRISEPK